MEKQLSDRVNAELEALQERINDDVAQTIKTVLKLVASTDAEAGAPRVKIDLSQFNNDPSEVEDPNTDHRAEYEWRLFLRGEKPRDALFRIFKHAGRPLKRAEWSGAMEEIGNSDQVATRARHQLLQMGLLQGKYGEYEITELADYYTAVLAFRGGDRDEAIYDELSKHEEIHGKIFEY